MECSVKSSYQKHRQVIVSQFYMFWDEITYLCSLYQFLTQRSWHKQIRRKHLKTTFIGNIRHIFNIKPEYLITPQQPKAQKIKFTVNTMIFALWWIKHIFPPFISALFAWIIHNVWFPEVLILLNWCGFDWPLKQVSYIRLIGFYTSKYTINDSRS